VDLLAIESNYDPPMQLRSKRPLFLKRRIMGDAGHLSNEQAFEAVRRILDRSPDGSPRHIVLLHRSRQCNCPQTVREVFARDGRIAARLTLSDQRRPTRWFEVVARGRGLEQLTLPF
jgi:phosphoribosyl 1,2-cyclic phosphodiesterase